MAWGAEACSCQPVHAGCIFVTVLLCFVSLPTHRGLLVDEHLRVVGTQGTIYCVGDAAVTGTTPQDTLPPTAQVAKQQGVYLANLLNRNKLALRPAFSAW